MTRATWDTLKLLAATWEQQAADDDRSYIEESKAGRTPNEQLAGRSMKARTCAADLLAHLASITNEPALDKSVLDDALYRAESAEARLEGAHQEIEHLRDALRRWVQAS